MVVLLGVWDGVLLRESLVGLWIGGCGLWVWVVVVVIEVWFDIWLSSMTC